MIRFVDEHKDRFGVEPLIGVLRGTDAMTPVGLWWALIRRYRPYSRCCAVQDRAAVPASTRW
jgi:hypothetical protein